MSTDKRKSNGPGASDEKPLSRQRQEQKILLAKQLDYDVDAWEPSLLERMLKASGRLQNR